METIGHKPKAAKRTCSFFVGFTTTFDLCIHDRLKDDIKTHIALRALGQVHVASARNALARFSLVL